jgi:hypothetical protein
MDGGDNTPRVHYSSNISRVDAARQAYDNWIAGDGDDYILFHDTETGLTMRLDDSNAAPWFKEVFAANIA